MLHFPVDFQERDGRWRDAVPADFVPVLYITADDRMLCASCLNTYECQRDRRIPADPAWRVTAFDLHYEGPDAVCTQCGSVTAALFGDPDAPESARG